MSTKNTTTNTSQETNQYDPQSKGLYNSLTNNAGSILNGYMNNPFSNPAYTLGLGESQRGTAQLGQNAMNVLNQNQRVSGLTGSAGAGWLAAQRAQTGRFNASMMSRAHIENIMNALNRQQWATGAGLNFQPLQTGRQSDSRTEQFQSGLGTWLPQVASMGLGAAMPFMAPAMGAMGGGLSMASMPSATAMNPFLANPNAVAPPRY
jgi:hypothetical protein